MLTVRRNNVFDNFFNDPWFSDFWFDDRKADKRFKGRNVKNLMLTDVREEEDGFAVEMDLPGFEKEDIEVTLDQGYLTVSAAKEVKQEDKEESGKYIRRERYTGSCQRSFYVGDAVEEEDVKASFSQGILKLFVPKKVELPVVEEKKRIAIEG